MLFRSESWPAGAVPPGLPGNPSPADGASPVAIDTTLSWTAGLNSESSDVYFGTTPDPGPADYQGKQTGTAFDPGILGYSTTYYWRIDEVNTAGMSVGPVWSFTTENDPAAGPTDLHVSNLQLGLVQNGRKYRGQAVVTIRNDWGEPVAGATVWGTFTGSYNETVSGVTDAGGVVELRAVEGLKSGISYTFCVDDVLGALPYDAGDNVVTCGNY
jgi:hypothetical protein